MTIKATEPRRGERFIHRRVGIDPRITACHLFGKARQFQREFRIEQAGPIGTGAVVEQRGDGRYSGPPKRRKTFITPAPVISARTSFDHLPNDGVANCSQPQPLQQLHVLRTVVVARVMQLATNRGSNPYYAALQATPDFERLHYCAASVCTGFCLVPATGTLS